jgi:hypothetical protein
MQNELQIPEKPGKEEASGWVTVIIGIVVALAIGLSLWFLFHVPAGAPGLYQGTVGVKMTPAEQAYLKNIKVEKIALSRAENFLHQEVTTLSGEVVNDGPEKILMLSLTVEFADSMDQIALRETRSVLGAPAAFLAPGERRPIEISFEHVPATWNMQQPFVRASYLQLSAVK